MRGPLSHFLVLAAAFAAVSGCQPNTPSPSAPKAALADSADQIMYGVTSSLSDAGLNRAKLKADTVFMFQDNTRAELRTVNAQFFNPMGAKTATLTSKEGTYDVRAGGMEARGNVLVITEDGRTLETQQLRYDPQKNEFSSDSAFVATEPDRKIEGVGFDSDPELNNIRIRRRSSGEGARVQVPSQ